MMIIMIILMIIIIIIIIIMIITIRIIIITTTIIILMITIIIVTTNRLKGYKNVPIYFSGILFPQNHKKIKFPVVKYKRNKRPYPWPKVFIKKSKILINKTKSPSNVNFICRRKGFVFND